MNELLEFFTLQDIVPLLALIALLEFAGKRISNNFSISWWARGFAAAAFLLYAAAGITTWEPTTASEFLWLGVRALLAMGMAHGLAVIVLPAIGFLHQYLWAKPVARQRAWAAAQAHQEAQEQTERERAEQKREEAERRAEAERRWQEEIANRPPPPTREQLMAAAKARYENTLRLLAAANLETAELQAGQMRAKQQFLREIDGLMK